MLVMYNFLLSEVKNWSSFLAEENSESEKALLKQHARTGRPLGDDKYIAYLEKLTGKNLKKKKPGPKNNN